MRHRRESQRPVPDESRALGPSSGSSRKREWNSAVSSSSASWKRAVARPASSVARIATRPSGRCRASARRPSGSADVHGRPRVIRARRYGPCGVTTSSTIGRAYSAGMPRSGRGATVASCPRPAQCGSVVGCLAAIGSGSDVARHPTSAPRRRGLAALAPAEAAPLPRRAAADAPRRRCSTSAPTRSASARTAGRSGCSTHNFFEEMYPWPAQITALGLHDGAGFRAHYPAIPYVQGDACALPFADGAFDVVFSNAVDRARRRPRAAGAVRPRGTARRPSRLPDDAEPVVPARGAHAPPARPLAPRRPRPPRLRARGSSVGEGEPPPRARRRSGRSSPAPGLRVRNLGLTLVAWT